MKNTLIRYGLAFVAGALSVISLFLIQAFPHKLMFGVVILVWLLVCVLMYVVLLNLRKHDVALIVATILASVGLLVLAETRVTVWVIVIIGGILVGGIFGLAIYGERDTKRLHKKEIRRMHMMLWVFDAYAIGTTILALSVFFLNISYGVWSVLLGVLYGLVSVMVWKLYFFTYGRYFFLWGALVGLMMFELSWGMRVLPFGYLATGFFLTWLWYVVQLFVRFHLTPQRIVWRKQRGFLVGNAVLFVVMMILVRWI